MTTPISILKLDTVIKEIKKITNNEVPFWIAGGAISSVVTGETVNDYDLFSPYPEALYDKLKENIGKVSFETKYFANFYLDKYKIQVIRRYAPKTPQEIFDTFDFTMVCGAYDGETFTCHDDFWQDIAQRRLVINRLTFPLRTLERVGKYSRRGYTMCPKGYLEICKAINAMEIDWENPDENMLSYYENGTPRFTGPD
jgi:hypothetical protein